VDDTCTHLERLAAEPGWQAIAIDGREPAHGWAPHPLPDFEEMFERVSAAPAGTAFLVRKRDWNWRNALDRQEPEGPAFFELWVKLGPDLWVDGFGHSLEEAIATANAAMASGPASTWRIPDRQLALRLSPIEVLDPEAGDWPLAGLYIGELGLSLLARPGLR
jgi:hypothetical protein